MADDVVQGMQRYYVERAPIYERVYFKPERQADLRAIEAWLPDVFAGRSVLEVACGTGWWTPHGARHAQAWLATDLSPETMAIARAKALPACVQLAQMDAYTFAEVGSRTFDGAFAGCWWSHVPLQRLPAWLDELHARLLPGARVVMLDNAYVEGNSTPVTRTDEAGNTYQDRVLDDGSVHEVLKNFPTRDAALALLAAHGRVREPEWMAHPHAYSHYWVLSYTLA
jgi:demethylmenaquinone methyltransferase/2-methoxy-6-polyprenyl-1,4-benzoquinol methylase